MLRHRDIWAGIDRLATRAKLSPSGLARRAGLDPTSFNISKRLNPQGKPRWPTTESIAKILDATDTTLADFVALVGPAAGTAGRRYPVTSLARAGREGYFDEAGRPAGPGWGLAQGPDVGDEDAYALEVSSDSMWPVFRPGNLIVVSPAAAIRRGDRVIVCTAAGDVIAREVVRRNRREVELRPVNVEQSDPVLSAGEVVWMHRILWSSQ